MKEDPLASKAARVAEEAPIPKTSKPTMGEAMEKAISPTAPGQSDASGVVVDLAQVVPPTTSNISLLTWIGVGSAVLFLILSVGIETNSALIQNLDDQIHLWAVANRTSLELSIARFITTGGLFKITIPGLILVGAVAARGHHAWRNRIGEGMLLASAASIGVLLQNLIKYSISRERPAFVDWAGSAGGFSYPSGHTTSATIFAAFSAWALATRFQTSRVRVALWSAASVYIIAVGWTRIWLGVHWPSDVLGAGLFGIAWAALVVVVIVAFRRRWPHPSMSGAAIEQPKIP